MIKRILKILLVTGFIWISGQSFANAGELQTNTSQLQQLIQEKDSLSKALIQNQTALNNLLQQKNNLVTSTKDIQTNLAVLQKQMTAYRKQLTNKSNEIKLYRKNNKALLKGNKAQKNKYNQQLASLQKQFTTINTKITTQKNKITNINTKYTTLKKQLANTNEKITTYKLAITNLKAGVKENAAAIKQLEKLIAKEEAEKQKENDEQDDIEQPITPPEVKPNEPVVELKLDEFNEQSNVLRSYNMGDGYTYYVLNDYEKYRAIITYDNYMIGGYETEVGKQFYDFKIGEQTYAHLQPKFEWTTFSTQIRVKRDNNELFLQFDEHANQTLRAIEWWTTIPAYKEHVQVAQKFISSDKTLVSTIYKDLANEFRVKNGLAPLQEQPSITLAAKGHSDDMAIRNFYDHNTPEGYSPKDRINRYINLATAGNGSYGYGENIAAGYQSYFKAHNGWINSMGHRTNLLNKSFKYIGFGIGYNADSKWGVYYTTNFVYY